MTKLRARALVVAAGCIEQPAVFQNNDLPGVMLASAAQRLIYRYAVRPMDTAVVLAANTEGYASALDLSMAGVRIAAIIDLRMAFEETEVGRAVAARGIRARIAG